VINAWALLNYCGACPTARAAPKVYAYERKAAGLGLLEVRGEADE